MRFSLFAPTLTVAILTSSPMTKVVDGRQYSGTCVTGIDLYNNQVIRFVRNKGGAPMENPYCNSFRPLQVCKVRLIERCPVACQTENALVNYQKASFLGLHGGGIRDLYERFQSIRYGDQSFMLDKSPVLDSVSQYKHSLEIIKASNFRAMGKKCSFKYQDKWYDNISLTASEYRNTWKTVGDAYLVVSIPSSKFGDYGYYKFVAAVFPN